MKTSSKLLKILAVSLLIELVAAFYLLFFDKLLYNSGILHWIGLLLYITITIVLALGVFGFLRGNTKTYSKMLGLINILAVILFILDAALGLPFTKFDPGINISSGIGWSYLFGFGAPGTSSLFSTSFAFTAMLVFSAITAILLFLRSKK
jgi:hypothetical protein